MNFKEFEEKVRQGGSYLPSHVVEDFLTHYREKKQKHFTQQDAAECIEVAGRATALLKAAGALEKPKPKKRFPKKLTQERPITNALIFEELEPQVEKLRREVYGDVDPPYTREDIEEILSFTQVKRVPIDELADFMREEIELTFENWQPEQAIGFVWTSQRLLEFAEKFSRETPFSEAELLLFVFTGIKPALRPYKVTLQPKTSTMPFETFSVQIFTYNVTHEVMQAIYKEIKSQTPPQRSRLTLKQITLLDVIDELGSVPHRGKSEYWQRVLRKCKARGVTSWTTSDAARNCYNRLQQP